MLKKLSKREIANILKTKELEDPNLIREIEILLRQKRGYVFKMPKPGTPIISLMSGGLDTTVVSAILMEEFNLQVYPVYFDRNITHSKRTKKSVKYFVAYFKKTYPKLFNDLQTLTLDIPAKEISLPLLKNSGKVKVKKNSEQRRGITFQPSVYAYNCVLYALYLEENKGVKIRDIFGSWLPISSDWYAYETLTALREIMFSICLMTRDFSWQFTSLPIEKELGFYFDKDHLISWGSKHSIPLEKTWTCSHSGGMWQCGECDICQPRREAFLKAGIQDKTQYLSEKRQLIRRLKRRAKKFLIDMSNNFSLSK